MNVATINPAIIRQKTSATAAERCPKCSQHAANTAPVNNSTRKYRAEISRLQLAHRAPSQTHVTSGIFKYQGIEYPQCGQWDGGRTTLSLRGSRWMQT